MNKALTITTVAIITIATLFTSCEIRSNCNKLYLTEEVKDYNLFAKGSWWKYDINNEYTDSLSIERSEQIEPHCEIFSPYWERIICSYRSTIYGYFRSTQIIATFAIDTVDGIERYYYNTGQTEGYKPDDIATIYFGGQVLELDLSFNDVSSRNNFSYNLKDINNFRYQLYQESDTTINNKSHEMRVYSFKQTFEIDSILPKKVWYARNIGMIKKEMFNGDIWTLIDFEIK